MNQKEFLRKGGLILLFFLIGGIAYLPNLENFGYFNDDWYLMYAANANGTSAFQGIYSIDRPARAVVMAAAYSMFGLNPLYYNLSAFIFRVLGSLAFLWTLRMIWPRQYTATSVMALLFLIYPGFLSTPNAIDYQAQQISLFLALFSIAISVYAVVSKPGLKILLWLVATVTTVAYLSLVEYFLGLEVLRLGLIYVLLVRKADRKIWQRTVKAFSHAMFFAVGSISFLIWRLFIFESERKATDFSAQISQFSESPMLLLVRWCTTLFQDSFEAIFLAWGTPLTSVWGVPLRLREMLLAFLLVSCAVVFSMFLLKSEPRGEKGGETKEWQIEAILLGLICVFSGMIPVVISNREANFYYFSRYMLASSAGAVIFITAVIFQFNTRATNHVAIFLLVTSAILTHHLNGVGAARATENMQKFWWQVSWRVPQFRPGTTLIANYTHTSIEEDYFVWGPANLIYYPENPDSERLTPVVWATVLTRDNLVSVLNDVPPKRIFRRSITTFMDYSNVLIMTQPFGDACVQFIDGEHPTVSGFEQYDVMQVASESNLDNILTGGVGRKPPEIIFGKEPEHTWCYYYETASLAYQQGNFEKVIELGQEARKHGYFAADPVEWTPFIQAAAIVGDQNEILRLAPKIKKNLFLANQACIGLTEMSELSAEINSFVSQTFCDK